MTPAGSKLEIAREEELIAASPVHAKRKSTSTEKCSRRIHAGKEVLSIAVVATLLRCDSDADSLALPCEQRRPGQIECPRS